MVLHMKTTDYTPAVKKITDRLDAIECGYKVDDNEIHLEWSMDELQEFKVDVYALLAMDEIADKFGADWLGRATITIWFEE